MKTMVECPCGAVIRAEDEDELVARTQDHLREQHPGMDYGRKEILFIGR